MEGLIRRYADAAGTQRVTHSLYDFDKTGRLTDLTHQGETATNILADYTWTYDVAHRQTSFDSLTDGSVTYSYDNRNQLTAADYDYQTDESYTYDDNGNRTNTGYTTSAHNRMTSDGTYNYEYDNEGNRTAKFIDVNNDGILNTGDTDVTEYTWDYRNRLTTIVTRSVSGGLRNKNR